MREERGDLWERGKSADAICITTNGFVKNNGNLVMGAGVAGQAQERWPRLPALFGRVVKDNGNHVYGLDMLHDDEVTTLLTFPVKHVWYEEADYELIARSALELVELTDTMGWKEVVLPRPGCGNGKLSWFDVKPIIEPILDDRFVVVQK